MCVNVQTSFFALSFQDFLYLESNTKRKILSCGQTTNMPDEKLKEAKGKILRIYVGIVDIVDR